MPQAAGGIVPVVADAVAWGRRMEALAFRLAYLRSRLPEFGVPPEIIQVLMEPKQVEFDRMQLKFGREGGRRKVYQTESRRFRLIYDRPSFRYRLFQWAVGAFALVLSPQQFYRLLDWYGQHDLKQVRALFAKPEPKVPASFIRRVPVSSAHLPV